VVWYTCSFGNFVHRNKLIPCFFKFAPLWILEWFVTIPSTWGFYLPRFDSALWVVYCPVIILRTPSTFCSS
jgi:hypothetical protein